VKVFIEPLVRILDIASEIHPLAPHDIRTDTAWAYLSDGDEESNSGGREFRAVPTLMKMVKNNSTDPLCPNYSLP
jgi:hypothetical protein